MSRGSTQTLSICLITDDKAGHLNQLKGLLYGLEKELFVDDIWIKTSDGLSKITKQIKNLSKQTLVVGAGHATWKYLVIAKKIFGLKTVVLMRPRVWPLSWFDLVVAPLHDNLQERKGVLITEGVLCPIPPADNPKNNEGLILIGGPSKHHDWNGDALLSQINKIISTDTAIQWKLTNSRRTPAEFLNELKNLNATNLSLYPVTETPPDWVRDHLLDSKTIWVGEDSMSMIFEALSTGNTVGVLTMPRHGEGRVTQCVDDLVERNYLTTIDYFEKNKTMLPAKPALQESIRVAKIVTQLALVESTQGQQA